MRERKGMVLLMVLAVLTLLCLLGLMFVLMANMERATARAYLDMVRAKMIAQSGIHSAMVNTRVLLTEKGFDIQEMEYGGEDLNGDGIITVGLELYENHDKDDKLQTIDCSLSRAVHPSFMLDRNHDGVWDKQDLIEVNGRKVGVSGIMPGPYDPDMGAYYTLKVEDLSGKIFINGVEDSDEKQMLERVLENLTDELLGKKWMGKLLSEAAPYATLEEVKTKLKLSEEDFIKLKSCITTSAWRDTGVIKPVHLNRRLGERVGVRFAMPAPGDDIFAWRVIRPLQIEYPMGSGYGGGKRLVGRAPVNINTASAPVLFALLSGLSGLYLDEVAYFQPTGHYDILKIYYNRLAVEANKRGSLGIFSSTPQLSREQAREIARAIIQNRASVTDPAKPWRGTFRSWQQFGLFCDKVLVEGRDHNIPAGFLTPQQADVLKANFNPNTNLTELNPPSQRLFWVGKDNLWFGQLDDYGNSQFVPAHSFEFSFFPTGYFLITSLGRLLGPENNVLAESEIQAAVQLFSLYRETTQKDFLEDFWSHNAPITKIFSPNLNPKLQSTTENLTLQAYPEILQYDSYQTGYCRGQDMSQSENLRNPYVQDAHYDGYIALATVENRDAIPNPDFRASYGAKFESMNKWNSQGMLNAVKPNNTEIECLAEVYGPYQNRLVAPAGLTPAERDVVRGTSGTLFPDGVYSERDCLPMYDYRPVNLDSFAVSMWVKPHFFPEAASKTRTFFTYQIFGTGELYPNQKDYPGLSFHNVFPLGIYSLVNGTEGGWARDLTQGYQYAGYYDNASFLACGGGTHIDNYLWGGGIITPCLNHIGTLPGTATKHQVGDKFHSFKNGEIYLTTHGVGNREYPSVFKAGKWLHLAWVHQTGTGDERLEQGVPAGSGAQYDVLWVNGIKCDGLLTDGVCHNTTNQGYLDRYYAADNILRLGEKKSAPWLNASPDATLDEVCIWDGSKLFLSSSGKNTGRASRVLINQIWRQGRYYRDNDGFFTSRAIDLCQQARLPTGTPITVFMVNWTQYVPEQCWRQTNDEQSDWRQLPDPSGYAKPPTCDIEILGAKSLERRGVRKSDPNKTPDPSGELIKDIYIGGNLVVTDPIRYRVLFKPNLPDPMNDILIDPLIFDDITIIYYSVPKFLSWAYRR